MGGIALFSMMSKTIKYDCRDISENHLMKGGTMNVESKIMMGCWVVSGVYLINNLKNLSNGYLMSFLISGGMKSSAVFKPNQALVKERRL